MKLAQTNEYAASVLLKNNTIVSHYLEGPPSYRVNRVQLDFSMASTIEISQFYFDQVLLVLQLRNTATGMQTLEFFNFAQQSNKYVHLAMI